MLIVSIEAMKVFLSHSNKDRGFVETLGAQMKAEGFDAWLCETSIVPGDNWVGEIDRGLTNADLVLLIWSPAAAASFATHVEWTSALAREISERKLRLGVVMLEDCALPEVIRTKQFTRGHADTIAWLKARRDSGRRTGASAPVYLPDYHPQGLIARGAYMEKMRRALIDERGGFLLTGEPGHGKSILALMFAWNAQSHFDAVIYQTCGERGVDVIAGELADKLRDQLGEGVVKLPPEKKLDAVKQWLKQRRSLLVLDDVWTNHVAVRDLFPGSPVSVLFTSRQRTFPLVANQILTVERFTPEEAEKIFRSYLGDEIFEGHRQALLDFAARMEHSPIAIKVGADLLRRQFGPLDAAARKLALSKLSDVETLFARATKSQRKPERRLLAAAAVCVSEAFWMPLAAEIAGLNADEGDHARDNLVNASLLRVVDRINQRFQIHVLLREHLRTKADQLREAHVAALERRFKNHETNWGECRGCLEEVIPAIEFLSRQKETSRQGRLSGWGYACAKRIGELDVAFRISKRDETFWMNGHGQAAMYGLQRCYGMQALILRTWNRRDEAMEVLKEQQAICLKLGDKESLQRCYGMQALILKDWGRLHEAMALHKKKEEICLELNNRDGLQHTYGNQGSILQDQERFDEAMALHKKKEAICLELGDRDGLQHSYGNQALILQAWGQLDEAMALLKKKEEVCLELGAKRHLGRCYRYWGLIARAQRDPATEKQKLEQALAIFTKLGMLFERDEVQAELNKSRAAEA
jgi:tetratricopeptide (TPR) repeat protein